MLIFYRASSSAGYPSFSNPKNRPEGNLSQMLATIILISYHAVYFNFTTVLSQLVSPPILSSLFSFSIYPSPFIVAIYLFLQASDFSDTANWPTLLEVTEVSLLIPVPLLLSTICQSLILSATVHAGLDDVLLYPAMLSELCIPVHIANNQISYYWVLYTGR